MGVQCSKEKGKKIYKDDTEDDKIKLKRTTTLSNNLEKLFPKGTFFYTKQDLE